jgi:DNA polymerase
MGHAVMNCTACHLCANALTVCIGGRGEGRVLVVGMNPGWQEDLAGEAFVGPSGEMLAELLDDAGFEPETYRLTNAVRCAGEPDNTAIDACRAHLTAEIHERRPEVIIALGDVALQSLTKKSGITAKRGQSFPLHSSFGYACEVWATLHPAYVIRTPNAYDTVLADLRRAANRGKTHEPIPWMWWDGAQPRGRVLSWDIETYDETGSVDHDRVTQIAVAGAGPTYVVRERDITSLAAALAAHDGVLATWNGWRFDVPKLRERTGIPVPYGDDCMVLAYLVDETQPMSLESNAVKWLRVPGWKEAKNAPLGSDEFALYNARDALYTRRLWAKFREMLGPRARIASDILLPALHALDGASARGIFIDGEAVVQAKAVATVKASHAATIVESLGVDNPNSAPQILAALQARGLRVRATDQAVLARLDDPLARAVLAYRDAAMQLRGLAPYDEAAHTGDGRSRCTYHLYKRDRGAGGTDVGRTSASGPNHQNLDRAFQETFFSAPPGRVLVKADYKAMHIRLAAWFARETNILDRSHADCNWDPHGWFAEEFIYGKNYTKEQRQIAKSANFSQLNIGGPQTLVDYLAKFGISMPMAEANRVHRAWHKAFPRFEPWYEEVREELREFGYVETATGQRRHFGRPKAIRRLSKSAFEDIARQAVNFKFVCLEAHIAMLALGEAHRRDLEIVLFVHDSISVEMDEATAQTQTQTLYDCMVTYPLRALRETFGVELDVPIVLDVTVKENKK